MTDLFLYLQPTTAVFPYQWIISRPAVSSFIFLKVSNIDQRLRNSEEHAGSVNRPGIGSWANELFEFDGFLRVTTTNRNLRFAFCGETVKVDSRRRGFAANQDDPSLIGQIFCRPANMRLRRVGFPATTHRRAGRTEGETHANRGGLNRNRKLLSCVAR
jgi:hypothetical protein